MQSFVVFACILAFVATTNAIETASVNARSLGGGIGLGGGSVQSSSSFSSSTVMSSFSSLDSQIGAIQGMMGGADFTQTIALQQMTRLAVSMRTALTQSAGCGCIGQGNFITSAGSTFSHFSSLMLSMQSTFGASFGSLLQPFGALSSPFQSFCQGFAHSGIHASRIIPAGLPSILSGVIPGITNMVGFK